MGTLSYGFDSQMDGKPAVTFMIYQVAGSNATEVNERIAAELEKMKERIAYRYGIHHDDELQRLLICFYL